MKKEINEICRAILEIFGTITLTITLTVIIVKLIMYSLLSSWFPSVWIIYITISIFVTAGILYYITKE